MYSRSTHPAKHFILYVDAIVVQHQTKNNSNNKNKESYFSSFSAMVALLVSHSEFDQASLISLQMFDPYFVTEYAKLTCIVRCIKYGSKK